MVWGTSCDSTQAFLCRINLKSASLKCQKSPKMQGLPASPGSVPKGDPGNPRCKPAKQWIRPDFRKRSISKPRMARFERKMLENVRFSKKETALPPFTVDVRRSFPFLIFNHFQTKMTRSIVCRGVRYFAPGVFWISHQRVGGPANCKIAIFFANFSNLINFGPCKSAYHFSRKNEFNRRM